MKNNFILAFLLLISLVAGILHLFWLDFSDYILNTWWAENHYQIQLSSLWQAPAAVQEKYYMWCSPLLIRGPIGFVVTLLLIPLSAVCTFKLINDRYNKKYWNKKLLIFILLIWFLKVPLPYSYSSIPAIEAGLFAL